MKSFLRMTESGKKAAVCFSLLASLVSFNATAGGPISVNESGEAASWSNGNISLHTESGTCATFTNSQMRTRLATNVAYWEDITGITLDFTIVSGSITTDVNSGNYNTYFVDSSSDPGLTDNLNPVVFDDDGLIIDAIFGSGSRFSVLGFAGPAGYNSTYDTIVDGQAFFNCRCLAGNSGGACSGSVVFTSDDLDFTMTHEIGHLIGLDHTQVNQSIAEDSDFCDTAVASDCDDVPTMYPQSVDAAEQITPTRDDEVAAMSLYGSTYLANHYCTVTGTLLDESGVDLRCADVQAQTTDAADTIAFVSGALAEASDTTGDTYTDDSGECTSGCGDFVLKGLDPAKNYTIVVKPISLRWYGGSSISPCGSRRTSTGIDSQTLTTISAGSCTAGSTDALGELTTTSTAGVDSAVPSSGGSSGGSSSSALGCTLSTQSTKGSFMMTVLFPALFVVSVFIFKKRFAK